MHISAVVCFLPLLLSGVCSECPSFEVTPFTPVDILGPWYLIFSNDDQTFFPKNWTCISQYINTFDNNTVEVSVNVIDSSEQRYNYTYHSHCPTTKNIAFANEPSTGVNTTYSFQHTEKHRTLIVLSCDEEGRVHVYAFGRTYFNRFDVWLSLLQDEKKYNLNMKKLKHANPHYCSLKFEL